MSLYLLDGIYIYNADGEHVSGYPYVLKVDATVHYLSKEHLPFAITAILILIFLLLPPFLLIFYPYKIFSRCLNCCHKRRWHALHTFVEAYHGCYKNGVTEGWDFRSMSGVYMLFRLVLVIVNYSNSYSNQQISWLLHVLMFLSLSILIIILQPYKKSYMNVLDGLLLALMGFLALLLVTYLYILPSSNETLLLIIVISSGLPQLVLLLSVTYRQLKGEQIAKCISGKVHNVIKQICTRNQGENQVSDADSLPHRLVSPNQYNNLCCQSLSKHIQTLNHFQ